LFEVYFVDPSFYFSHYIDLYCKLLVDTFIWLIKASIF